METERLPEDYGTESVNRIIRHALTLKDTASITYAELREIGEAFDIDEATLKTAIRAEASERRHEQRLERRRHAFRIHFYNFLGVNMILIIINSLVPGPWWFQWSLLGWGIGVYCHYKAVHAPRLQSRLE